MPAKVCNRLQSIQPPKKCKANDIQYRGYAYQPFSAHARVRAQEFDKTCSSIAGCPRGLKKSGSLRESFPAKIQKVHFAVPIYEQKALYMDGNSMAMQVVCYGCSWVVS